MTWLYRRKNKFGNNPVRIDNHTFPSTHEGNTYKQLKALLQSGAITELVLQKRYDLRGQNGHKICEHYVDFWVEYPDGSQEVFEAKSKSTATDVWKLKWKLFEDNYPNIKYTIVLNRPVWPKRNFQRRTA